MREKGPLSMEGGPCRFMDAVFPVVQGRVGCGTVDEAAPLQTLLRFRTDLTRRPKALSFLRLSRADMAACSASFLSFM